MPSTSRSPVGSQQNEKWHLKFLEKPALAACVALPGGAPSGSSGKEPVMMINASREGFSSFFFFFPFPPTSFYRKYMLEMKLK